MKNRSLLWGWGTALLLAHVWVYFFLFKGALIPCGDSEVYLEISQKIGIPSANRPSGYPLILFFVDHLSRFSGLPYMGLLALLNHGMALASGLVWADTLLKGANSLRSKILLLAILSFAQFLPLTLFLHSMPFMPDSLALSFNTLLLCYFYRSKPSWWFLPASLFGGCIGLLRSGQVAVSTFLIPILAFLFLRRGSGSPRKKIGLSLACAFLLLLPSLLYHSLFAGPRLGQMNMSYIGGLNSLAQVIRYLNCDEIAALTNSPEERKWATSSCREGEMKNLYGWHVLHSPDLFFARMNSLTHDTEIQTNVRYQRWSRVAILQHPGKFLRAGWDNLAWIFRRPVFLDFQVFRGAAACLERIPAKWNLGVYEMQKQGLDYYYENAKVLSFIDKILPPLATVFFSMAILFLFCPLLHLRLVLRAPGWLPSYVAALALFLTSTFGVHFDTRHFIGFAMLSFLQFSLFLPASLQSKEMFRNT